MPLYFAYGSNMDRAAMARRCPGAEPVEVARLHRHRFVIMREGYASVVRDPGHTVWGLLWSLTLADIPPLDRYEGVAGGLYVKAQQPVTVAGGGVRRALIYLGRSQGGAPRPGYLEGVVAAAREAGLPGPYLRGLEAMLR
ncbi:gamma-glutamylcyclotransferase family protein [Methylobacterium oryzihabitans]|uniref:Gamma-glutamylcyclotransferase n=1 Tax=Methylobacterium oryzihabitans TaxID=2499852 RepID=A0A437P4H6_9HYPH|nr:gamma-glutamylcyclotransferase family protein [Methylobacterium oryzihabitans]RVU17179.1 gamma-glutamylcyclotransferase [Methylobacterium oryzihabitans]